MKKITSSSRRSFLAAALKSSGVVAVSAAGMDAHAYWNTKTLVPKGNGGSFKHGIASGDPAQDAVILWTRITPEKAGPVEVLLEVSRDKGFKYVVAKKVSASTC